MNECETCWNYDYDEQYDEYIEKIESGEVKGRRTFIGEL